VKWLNAWSNCILVASTARDTCVFYLIHGSFLILGSFFLYSHTRLIIIIIILFVTRLIFDTWLIFSLFFILVSSTSRHNCVCVWVCVCVLCELHSRHTSQPSTTSMCSACSSSVVFPSRLDSLLPTHSALLSPDEPLHSRGSLP